MRFLRMLRADADGAAPLDVSGVDVQALMDGDDDHAIALLCKLRAFHALRGSGAPGPH